MKKIQIYTDGACSGNPGPGGWAARILFANERIEEIGGAAPETTNNRMELLAAIEALKGSQESVIKMVSEFKSRRDLIVDGLNNIKNISCPKPSGAFYVFPNITKTGLSSELFASRLLQENGVATLSGESFGQEGKGYIRISFANSKANILEALNRIEDFVNKL